MSIPLEVSVSLHIAGLENRIEQLEQRNSGLEAARIAYANEFPLNSDGEPDVGSIHQNIRKLKADYAQLEADLAESQKVIKEGAAMHNIEAFEVMRRDKLEELLDEYFDLAVEKGRNFERNGLRSNQVRKEILSLFDLASQEQQTESKVLDLIVKHGICVEFTHDQMAVTAFWCGNPDINFTEIASGDLASATRNCVIKVVESLPPAPEGGDKWTF